MNTAPLGKLLAASAAALALLAGTAHAVPTSYNIADSIMTNNNVVAAMGPGTPTFGNYGYGYPGDVFLGFSSASANKDYVIDLGSLDQVQNFRVGSFVNLNADLSAVFGVSWYGQSDLVWSAFGVIDDGMGNPTDILTSVVKGGAAPGSLNLVIQSLASTPFTTIVNALSNDAAYGQGLAYGVWQQNGVNGDSKSGGTMWLGVADASTPFGVYNVPITASAYFSGGGTDTNKSNLELYDVKADGVTVTRNATFLSLDAQGNLTAVPEPSTWMLLGVGALLMVVAYRRRYGQ
jgi:hypothetical protein